MTAVVLPGMIDQCVETLTEAGLYARACIPPIAGGGKLDMMDHILMRGGSYVEDQGGIRIVHGGWYVGIKGEDYIVALAPTGEQREVRVERFGGLIDAIEFLVKARQASAGARAQSAVPPVAVPKG